MDPITIMLIGGAVAAALGVSIASGGTAYLEHTGWFPARTLYNRRTALNAWPT